MPLHTPLLLSAKLSFTSYLQPSPLLKWTVIRAPGFTVASSFLNSGSTLLGCQLVVPVGAISTVLIALPLLLISTKSQSSAIAGVAITIAAIVARPSFSMIAPPAFCGQNAPVRGAPQADSEQADQANRFGDPGRVGHQDRKSV